MPTTGEVRFASYLKAVIDKIDGINALTSASNEDKYFAELEALASDAQLMIAKDNPKLTVVTKGIIDQVAYWKKTRRPKTGDRTETKTYVGGRVATELRKLLTVLDLDPQILIKEVEIPKNPVGDVETPPVSEEMKKPSDTTAKDVKPAGKKEEEKMPMGTKIAIGGGILAGVVILAKLLAGGRRRNPRRRRNPDFLYTMPPVLANPRRRRRQRR